MALDWLEASGKLFCDSESASKILSLALSANNCIPYSYTVLVLWLVNKMIWFCCLYYIDFSYAKTTMEKAIAFVFWGLNQGTFWDNRKELEHLDLACSMYLMVVFIFISIDSSICDLEKGLSNYSNWSLPEKTVENSKHFTFSFLLVSCHADARVWGR